MLLAWRKLTAFSRDLIMDLGEADVCFSLYHPPGDPKGIRVYQYLVSFSERATFSVR